MGAGILVAATCLAAPAAQARTLRTPKWLKGPYHRYQLILDASESIQVNEVTTTNNPPEGSSRCDYYVRTAKGTSASQVRVVYDFLFGRYRLPHSARYRFSFVWQLKSHSGSGQGEASLHNDPPSGCPPAVSPPTGSCAAHVTDHKPNAFVIEAGATRHNVTSYGVSLSPGPEWGDPTCSGDQVSYDHNPPVPPSSGVFLINPTFGRLIFTDRGVKAGRSFQGSVRTDVGDARSGQGTDPLYGGLSEVAWSFTTGQTASFTLAPAH